MSTSFYYVVTYNVQHPTVKKFLEGLLAVSESLMEFKVRSKLFHDFIEVSEAAHKDFDLKSLQLYDPSEIECKHIRWITAINPAFDPDLQNKDAIVTSDWQDHCAGSIFFTEVDGDEEDEEDDEVEYNYEPKSWMFKYELFFTTDIMEVCVNGEAAFSPSLTGVTTSSYH